MGKPREVVWESRTSSSESQRPELRTLQRDDLGSSAGWYPSVLLPECHGSYIGHAGLRVGHEVCIYIYIYKDLWGVGCSNGELNGEGKRNMKWSWGYIDRDGVLY